jgi:acyl-coenzyme A synthetase/AMP-(fatty) acid ligase
VSPTLADLPAYRSARESYRLDVPEYFNFGDDVIDRWASQQPDACALWWVGPAQGERRLTFAELADRSNRIANGLRDLGLARGDQVMLNLPSVPEWWESMVGLTKADMVAIPTTTMLTEKDIVYRVERAEIDGVITDASGADKVERVAGDLPGLGAKVQVGGEPRPGWVAYEDVIGSAPADREPLPTTSEGQALIYFTSGTTGPPKMVLHSHASYGIGQRLTADFWLSLEPRTVHWNMSDTGWAKTAYAGYFGPWISGATVFVAHRPGKFDAKHTLETLARFPIESLCAPPTVYRMLLQEDLDEFEPMALRHCRAAGEALNAHVLQRWREATGITIREGYGQSETVFLCGCLPDLPVKPGSMGLPPPGIELAVVDVRGDRLPPGQTGEIAVHTEPERPVGLFTEYWHDPDATAGCYRNGWYLTGDCAYTDEDGYFWFVARADDIITSSAYRIGPFEVESALMEHPAVAEVAVVGKPDPDRTEIVKAFVVLAAEHEPSDELVAELQTHVKRTTAPYKYPREIEFLEELPKTVSGKIRRVELRNRG